MRRTAVLLMAHGAASRPEEIPDYLQDIRGGRPPTEEMVRAVSDRYRAIGGRSPLLDITRRQAEGLEAELGMPVSVGMRHSRPTIAEAVETLDKAEVERLVAIPLTPYRSAMSVGAYMARLDAALADAGVSFEVVPVSGWHLEPDLIAGFTDKLAAARARLPEPLREGAQVVFTAHSLPERVRAQGDPYPGDFEAAARATAERLGLSSWKAAYQSRSPGAPEPWLGPDAAEVIEAAARAGAKAVVLAPIGFISDHMETLYDVDVQYRLQAEGLGLAFERAATLNDGAPLIRALASAARRALAS